MANGEKRDDVNRMPEGKRTSADEGSFSEAEAELAKRLTEGPMDAEAPEQEAVARLAPRWEVRIQTEHDPVAEETTKYRKLAKEVDEQYDGR